MPMIMSPYMYISLHYTAIDNERADNQCSNGAIDGHNLESAQDDVYIMTSNITASWDMDDSKLTLNDITLSIDKVQT